MPKHHLLQLTKKKWEELKKEHNMKVKGMLVAFFTKLTGINVGDHIDKFNRATQAAADIATTTTVNNVVKSARSLEKALRDYAAKKEFGSSEAKEFKSAVLRWAAEAKDYANTFERVAKDNKEVLARNEHELIARYLADAGLL